MFHKAYFVNKTREEIKKKMQEEGFTPQLINESPGQIHKPEQQQETEYLVCLEGSMEITLNGKKYNFEQGDKLLVPENTMLSGIVGQNGCVYFWSEKII